MESQEDEPNLRLKACDVDCAPALHTHSANSNGILGPHSARARIHKVGLGAVMIVIT